MFSPLCFVLSPFGKKLDNSGLLIDFDSVCYDFICPAIEEAGLNQLEQTKNK
jgi:hypothetical protein